MNGVHVKRQDFFGDRHWPRLRLDWPIGFLSPRPRFHESEQAAMEGDLFRQLIKRNSQVVEAEALTRSQAPGN